MKLKKRIVILPGDGIGPEVTRAAVSVLQECAREFGHQFDVAEMPIGGAAIEKTGDPLPPETLEACRKALARVLGHPVAVEVEVEPALIAGIELESPHAVVRNSFRADLVRLKSELVHRDRDLA